MDWTDLAQDKEQWTALVNTVLNLQVILNAQLLNSCITGSLSRKAQFYGVSYSTHDFKDNQTEKILLTILNSTTFVNLL
jgi:hypothetical protein